MVTQVFQTEVARDYFPKSSEALKSQQASKKNIAVVKGVELYPEALSGAVMHVNQFAPQMFSILPSILGRRIQIHLQVDVPIVRKGYVRASDLKEKNITTRDLIPDKKGLIRVDDLFKQGVVVSPENFVAQWEPEVCILSLSSAHFSRYHQEYWRDVQVSSLLFELQNAQFTPELQSIEGRSLSKEDFVKRFEEIEFTTTALTCARLQRLSDAKEFNDGFNFCSYTYDNFELFYLHQQALNHSYPYAQFHDEQLKTETHLPYKGTWAVPLPLPSKDGTLSDEQILLQKVLTCHLDALYDSQKEFRDKKQRELEQLITGIQEHALAGKKCYQNVWENIQFFQGRYEAYVQSSSPDRVLHLVKGKERSVPLWINMLLKEQSR